MRDTDDTREFLDRSREPFTGFANDSLLFSPRKELPIPGNKPFADAIAGSSSRREGRRLLLNPATLGRGGRAPFCLTLDAGAGSRDRVPASPRV